VKFEKRAGDFAVASAAVQLQLEGGRCRDVAISLGAVGPTAIRAEEAERMLNGQAVDEDLVTRAEPLVRDAAQPFADTRGSVEYKRHLAAVLFRRAMLGALDRARGNPIPTIHL
jgi:carbon-monoxide dehydrogenase medium subunit